LRIGGTQRRTLEVGPDGWCVEILDQTRLPFEVVVRELRSLADAAEAIASMRVRGAPLIGVTAAYGLCLALRADASDAALESACKDLLATRPTAVNLAAALDALRAAVRELPPRERTRAAYAAAARLADADVATNEALGRHGLRLLEAAAERAEPGAALNVLTHCNAGALATVDLGTALAPVYLAHDRGQAVHVWVSETRPRNQGSSLTAFELREHGVPHTVVADNAAGHLIQRGRVDLCLVGTDRTTATGDVCNKIGTYLKALAAREGGVPFYVAVPSSSIDWELRDGAEIPIEERPAHEVGFVSGRAPDGRVVEVRIGPDGARAANPAFDVTPARLVSALVTERGVCPASAEGLLTLFPERRSSRAATR
jgi:methylthioribose-1-phosphate isomerase